MYTNIDIFHDLCFQIYVGVLQDVSFLDFYETVKDISPVKESGKEETNQKYFSEFFLFRENLVSMKKAS